MEKSKTYLVAIINGKPDYFFMMTGSHRIRRKLEKYTHLNMPQYYALGNAIRKAKKSEIARHGTDR